MSGNIGEHGVEGIPQEWPDHLHHEDAAPLDLGAHDAAAGAGHEAAGHEAGDHYQPQRLALGEHDHLPWLEAGEDEEYHEVIDFRRVMAVVVAGILALAAVVGAIWFGTHRHDAAQPVADGSTIAAPDAPYKASPQNAGGKTFQGTGDTSFAVSRGKSPTEHLAESGKAADGGAAAEAGAAAAAASEAAGASAAKPADKAEAHSAPAKPAAKPAASDEAAASGGLAQIGAYHSQARAEQAWAQLSGGHEALSGVQHRITTGQVDGSTVYRLQVVTAAGAAGALCDKLRSAGLSCQVKH